MACWSKTDLCGPWRVAQYPTDEPDDTAPRTDVTFLPAAVPGAVQYDLVKAGGMLANPFESTEAALGSAWVAKSDWLYQREFSVDLPADDTGRWFLNIDGVDTFSEVWLNGCLIGKTRNNYRLYEFPVDSDIVKASGNLLQIRVQAHHRMLGSKVEAAREKLGHGAEGIEGLLGKSLIRRYQRSFFTNSSLLNIGTGVLGIGINRPVSLSYYADSRVTDCVFRTISAADDKAVCELIVEADGADCCVKAVITDPESGDAVAELQGHTAGGRLTLPVNIANPRLWYPAGYGRAFLYKLKVELIRGDAVVHGVERQIGIKTVRLVTKLPNGRNTFYFQVNGKRIWARGQNTIPLDYIKVYGTQAENRRLFRLLENAHTNLVRIWGGGMLMEDSFYDACDRLGIMLWSEGFLHSNVYPDYDREFVAEYEAECREMLKLVRRHPSLCMVCGGNEQIEGWEEYGWQGKLDRFYGETLFTELLPPIAKELCPDIPYIINSPHGGADCQSPVEGESHNWGNYFNSFKDPLFVSETCWSQESYSRPETLERYMGLRVGDYEGPGWLERWTQRTTRTRIGRLAYSNWPHKDNPSLRRYLHTLELEQALADYNALRQFRLRSPSNNGVIYWSFNKGGPLFQFGCVDYGGVPLMSYYMVSRLYRALSIGLFRDGEELYAAASNQSGQSFEGRAEILHLASDGRVIGKIPFDVKLEDGQSKKVFSCDTLYGEVIDRTGELFAVRLYDVDGALLGEEILLLCPFAEFRQEDRPLQVSAKQTGVDIWELEIEADCVVSLLEIEGNHNILCSDNYFPLVPGTKKMVTVELLEKREEHDLQLELSAVGETCKTTLRICRVDS